MKGWSVTAAGLMLMAAAAYGQQQQPGDILHSILNPATQTTHSQALSDDASFRPAPYSETDFLTHGNVALPVAPTQQALYRTNTAEQILTLAGAPTTTVLAAPVGATPAAGILIIPGIEGLNSNVRGHLDFYARRGILVLAVDLYGGIQPRDRRDAMTKLRNLDRERTLARMKDAMAWLSSKTKFGQLGIGVAGYGLGADWVYPLAAAEPRPLAVAVFGGGATTDVAVLRDAHVPLIGFFSKQDLYVTPARVEAFEHALKNAGIRHEVISYHVEPNFAIEPRHGAARNYAVSAVERTVNLLVARRHELATSATTHAATTATLSQ